MCHIQYNQLESRIHDLEDGSHVYWTTNEYDNITKNLPQEREELESLTVEIQEENLFTEFDSDSGGDSGSNIDTDVEERDSDSEVSIVNSRGVKSVCPLNVLSSFHSVTSFPPDFMHDMMEGVIAEDLLAIIRILSENGWFTITQYNITLERLDFLSYESGDKPYPVPISKKVKKLKGSIQILRNSSNF